jgi:hypothetical protein
MEGVSQRIFANTLDQHTDKEVLLRGWVYRLRVLADAGARAAQHPGSGVISTRPISSHSLSMLQPRRTKSAGAYLVDLSCLS